MSMVLKWLWCHAKVMMHGFFDLKKNPILLLIIALVLIPLFLLHDVVESYLEFKRNQKCD